MVGTSILYLSLYFCALILYRPLASVLLRREPEPDTGEHDRYGQGA
jgi:hypothetical protein